MRKAAMVIPWVREVMEVGEVLTARQIIGRIKAHNVRLTGKNLMLNTEKKHSRNLRHLPNANSLSYILGTSDEYERAKNDGIISWRRVV